MSVAEKVGMAGAIAALFSDPTYRSLGISLDAAAQRHAAIASNIANVNTPGYKRLDLTEGFQAAMKQALEQLDSGKELFASPTPAIGVAAQQGLARQDGNTVNIEREMIDMMQNQSRFDFAAQMTAKKLKSIRMAATGRSG